MNENKNKKRLLIGMLVFGTVLIALIIYTMYGDKDDDWVHQVPTSSITQDAPAWADASEVLAGLLGADAA